MSEPVSGGDVRPVSELRRSTDHWFEPAGIGSSVELHALLERARADSDADGAAIQMFGGDRDVYLALSPMVAPLRSATPGGSLSRWAASLVEEATVLVVADASTHSQLCDNPWVNGEHGRVRFYAAALLLDDDGAPRGTLSAWARKPASDVTGMVDSLAGIRDEVAALLTLHTHVAGRAPAVSKPAVHPRGGARRLRAEETVPTVAIGQVLAAHLVRTVFQPIVHLPTGTVTGYEALSRGPAGSTLEAPLDLVDAARRAHRLGELDWACRVNAMQEIARSRLPEDLSWFINAEPAGMAMACPPHLRDAYTEAREGLRLVLEIVERDQEAYVASMLEATALARDDRWGIAMDDLGAQESSLALMPLVQPDVVKLDMSLVQSTAGDQIADVSAGVRAYTERTGAAILAEGIETEDHEQAALVLGATYGQGFRYGHPGPLPSSVATPLHPIPLGQHPEPADARTPYEILAAGLAPQRSPKRLVLHISEHLEEQASRELENCVMFVNFEHARYFSPGKQRLYSTLAAGNTLTIVVGEQLAAHDAPGYRIRALSPDNPMIHEWQLIVLSPHYAAAFLARDVEDSGPDSERRFDFVYTHERAKVIAAARAFLHHTPAGGGARR